MRKQKLTKWQREARHKEEKRRACLRAVDTALTAFLTLPNPSISNHDPGDYVVKAHNVIAGMVRRLPRKGW